MGKAARRRNRQSLKPTARTRSAAPMIGIAAVVFVVTVGTLFVLSGTSADPDSEPPVATGDAAALQPIGGSNEMGFPYVSTPGSATGTASAGGVSVEGASWTLGHVPLSVAVLPQWTLTNTGRGEVALGAPQAEVRAGCCPGPFTLGTHRLAPGESTTLTFELAMHEGMDGWHDMGVYVPVSGKAGTQTLALGVTGDFS
jgi:hypothetical protein